MTRPSHNLTGMLDKIRKWAALADAHSDQELTRRYVAGGDEAAFACLVERYGPLVLGVCRKMVRHEQDAEDAFQATFLVLAKRAGTIRKQESVGGWLYGVAYRVANKLRAGQARRRAREAPLAVDPGACPADGLHWREVEALVFAELDRLSDKYRAPLLLCYVQGKTRDEAAQQLGCNLGVLRGRLERGRDLLRSRLTRRGLSLSALFLCLDSADKAAAAPVSISLFTSTLSAALSAARNSAAAGLVSARVAALTVGVTRTMFFSNFKTLGAAVVTLTLVAGGASLMSQRSAAQDQATSAQRYAQASSVTAPADEAAGVVDEPRNPQAAQVGTIKVRQASQPDSPAKLREENARLRAELEQTRAELLAALRENTALRTRAVETERELSARKEYPKYLDELRTKLVPLPAGPLPLPPAAAIVKEVPLGPIADSFTPVRPRPAPLPAAVSSDARTVVVAIDNALLQIDMQTGKQMARSVGHDAAVTAIGVSPDGTLIASASQDKTVSLWEAATFRQLHKLALPNPATVLRFSPDSRALVVVDSAASERRIDVATGKVVHVTNTPQK